MIDKHAIATALQARITSPWAIAPARLDDLQRLIGGSIDLEAVAKVAGKGKPLKATKAGRATVIPVMGILVQRTDFLSAYLGEVGTEDIGRLVKEVIDDNTTDAIIFAFDSPGGSVFGVGELAETIRAAGAVKKTIGCIDSMAASGGYWLASQCREICITPGATCT